MRNTIFCITILMVLSISTSSYSASTGSEFRLSGPQLQEGGEMRNDQILNGFGCTGMNISPELRWQNAPEETKSFAVTLYDPDAPTGSGWWHWVVYNIPKDEKRLIRDAGNASNNLIPRGAIQSRTDFGTSGYGGACPPKGNAHRYIFTVYALDTEKLTINEDSSGAMVGFFLNQHTISKAQLSVTYGR